MSSARFSGSILEMSVDAVIGGLGAAEADFRAQGAGVNS